jgi:hypothetical protein
VLRNAGSRPALMARVEAVREKSGDRILPVLYSHNYIALLPREKRTHPDRTGAKARAS